MTTSKPFKTNTNWELKKAVMFCARHFFCSQVFKTTSNVLNSDVNIVNIALIAFCPLAVTNLAHWATSSLRQWNAIYQFFTLRDQLVGQQKCSLILWCRLREVVAKSRAQVYFSFVPRLSSNLQLVTQQIFSCCATNWGFCISYFSPPLLLCGSLADRLLQLSFVLALLWLNSV